MFYECLERIDANATREMASLGVQPVRVSDWRARRRLPTRPQALALAYVMKLNFEKLERELATLEAEKDAEKNSGVAVLMQRLQMAGRILYLSTRAAAAQIRGVRPHNTVDRALRDA